MAKECTTKEHFITALKQIVDSYPELIAVSELNGKRLSYQSLWQQSMAVSAALRKAGCVKNQLVAVQINKSCDFVVALLGVWLTGCAFMVLDPQQPKERLLFMCAEAHPAFLLYGDDQNPVWQDACSVAMNDIPAAEIDWAERLANADDMAYLLYTSGSSGQPKGVRVAHRGLICVLQSQIQTFGLTSGQNSLWLHSIAFDASISDIGTALLSGSQLCIIPGYTPTSTAQLVNYIEQLQINFVDIPPALLQWIDPKSAPVCWQTLVVGGEVCPAATLRSWAEHKRVVLVYGPTEATICTSMEVVNPDNWQHSGIGLPMPHVEYRIKTTSGEPDNEGELLIGGRAVALGYLNRRELESEKFVYLQQQRYYATGDRVRKHFDGRFEFLGRTDRQVKVSGKLVAPEEVEFCLASHPMVKHAAVVPWTHDGITRLVAFIEVVDDLPEDEIKALEPTLQAFVQQKLPGWMIPRGIHRLHKLPLNQHQKVDLSYLAQLPVSEILEKRPAQNSSELEQLFCQVMGQTSLDPDMDCFEQGVDSMGVVAILSLAQSKGIPLTAKMLYEYRTINRIKERLLSKSEASASLSSQWLNEQASEQVADIELSLTQTQDANLTDILLTGASGYFGSCLLPELLSHTQGDIYCLVRGPAQLYKPKVIEAISQHGLSISVQQLQRIKLVEGDLQQVQFGWSDKRWLSFSRNIVSIYHCAADTSIVKPYEMLKASNVEGTRTVMQFAVTGRKKALHYVSTLSVFVDASPKPKLCLESDKLEQPVRIYGGYAQSKWVAEKMLHLFAPNLAQLSIYRLGLLTARLDGGKIPSQDWFSLVLKHGVIDGEHDGDERLFDFTPVDYAAKALTYISVNATVQQQIFHIANPHPVSARLLAQAMTEVFDRTKSNDPLASDINRNLNSELKVEQLNNPISLFKRTATDFAMSHTEQALVPSQIRPAKIDIHYLKQYCKKVGSQFK